MPLGFFEMITLLFPLHNMKLYINLLIVSVVSFVWSYIYYADGLMVEDYTRPFVYRQLVPLLARGIEFLGVPGNIALIVVMTLSGVGFYLALRKLAQGFYNLSDRHEICLVVGVLVSMLVMGAYRKPYDLMTVFLFALAFYYIYTVNVWKYLLVFTLVCVNRETAFLLIPISVVVWWELLQYGTRFRHKVWLGWVASVGIFAVITCAIRIWFANYPGLSLWINPIENMQQLVSHPYLFLMAVFLVFGMVLWMFRKPQPEFLKLSFNILAPALLVMWIVCGQWGEPRVFWELAPVVILLMVL